MAATAGQVAYAGKIPGERIATDIDTADSSTFTTTETTVQSVTAALVEGRTYRVRWTAQWLSSVANDIVHGRIREDSVSGTEIAFTQTQIMATGTVGWPGTCEGEYTATATGNKTFVGTGDRASGTGNCNLEAASTRPTFLYVDYVRN